MENDRRYRSDDRDLDDCDNDLVVMPPDGNGDWYVSVLPHGHKIGPTVRVTTSGSPRGQRGVSTAVARLYRAMGGEEEPSLLDFEPHAPVTSLSGVDIPPHLLTTPVWPVSAANADPGTRSPTLALPTHPYWQEPAVAIGGVLFAHCPPTADVIVAHEQVHGRETDDRWPTCQWLVHSPAWKGPHLVTLGVHETPEPGEVWAWDDGHGRSSERLTDCGWAKDAVWTPLSAAGLPVWWVPTGTPAATAQDIPGVRDDAIIEAVHLVIGGLHGAADERRARKVAIRLAELGVTGVGDLPDAVCMAESLAAARRVIARKRSADESIVPPADLGPRIEAFCEQHMASTGQLLTEQNAVRLLLVVGLETAVKVRRCPHCLKPFPTGKRRHARWCSDNCRKATSVRKAQQNRRVSAVVG
jgi:hypothetical protein